MQVVILAAGMGKRLGEYTRNNTKCMVPINGIPLIDRMLDQLSLFEFSRCVIVIGYEGVKLKKHIGNVYKGLKIEYVENPFYEKTNNIYSLALAKRQLQEDDTILIESDLIFDTDILSLLLTDPYPNLALVPKYESWMDGTMVRIDKDSNIVSFISKEAFNYSEKDSYYKTVNIYKFSKDFCQNKYIPFLNAYTQAVGNNEYYENVLRIISFLTHDLKAKILCDEKWYEIDDKQDLDIAEAIFADENHILRKYYGRYGGFWRFPQLLDYCYLVNPYFPSAKMIDEMRDSFSALLTGYPSGLRVNSLLASKCWGVKEEYIVPGNGAAELINVISDKIKGKIGIIRPTFEEYPNRFPIDRVISFYPNNEDFRYGINDIIDFFSNQHIDYLLLINPDNPSGNFIKQSDVFELLGWCSRKGIRLILDESFVDFSDEWETNTLLQNDFLEHYPNLIVIKSISKSYGVPGLRLGLLASSDTDLVSEVRQKVSIWNINSFAEYFMQILTKYEADYKSSCRRFITERQRFISELSSIPFLRVMPTQANFVLCEVMPPFESSEICYMMLHRYKILMSSCSSKIGLTRGRYLRIAIRNKEDNSRLIHSLKSLSL